MNALEELRNELGLTKREFAKSIKVDEGNYNKYESGKLKITGGLINKIKNKYPDMPKHRIDKLLQVSLITGGKDPPDSDCSIQLEAAKEKIKGLEKQIELQDELLRMYKTQSAEQKRVETVPKLKIKKQ